MHRDARAGSRRYGVAAVLYGIALLVSPATQAASVEKEGVTSCTINAFAIDPDPKGSNIRSAPRADAPVIGHLPPRVHLSPVDIVGAEFEIIGSKDGWLLIQNAEATVDEQLNTLHAFEGPGWLSGRLVGVTLGSANLRAQPRRDAAIIARLANAKEGWGADSYRVSGIHACAGDFVDVTTAWPRKLRGWSWKPCSSQLTTCDRSSSE